ncbi:MAG: pantoate--beta-alanine ligase [Bacteroidetes bacterium HGW-Bacteroidetes-7]|jgi:pantoate--beta-alanine ligase|nr:MAG: pantoate--beta-alanine ligase [Bacteroidetes bacterium HGW-Bacteroidetes-7]
MTICYTLSQFYDAISLVPKGYEVGFVPTMGALHQGHISLVNRAAADCKIVVVSIFVNPTQFNNPADLEKYPRTLENDCEMLEKAGATIVFIPSIEEIYPQKDNRIFDLGGLDSNGEGPHRPGHFNGVAQVVTRLFDIVEPKFAYFGEKDFQQLAIIRYFSKKLNYPLSIVSCPTVRESDGLAMSSRNLLLTPEHRKVAPAIYKTLKKAAKIATAQNLSQICPAPQELTKWVISEINSEPLLKTEYAEIVDSISLCPVKSWDEADEIQLCTAVFAGAVRLIDNIKLK